jgi:hypothetical protein
MLTVRATVQRQAAWPLILAIGAVGPHVLFLLGMAVQLLAGSLEFDVKCLLWEWLFLLTGPLGCACSLAGIVTVCRHVNGGVLLLSVLTLPLNVWLCLPALFGMLFGLTGG